MDPQALHESEGSEGWMRTSTAHEVGWFVANLASRAREGQNVERIN